jgi:RHS repeat-associated protein
MATRTWGSSAITGTYRYDGAKRPISLTIARTGQGQNDLISRTYDLVGNVKSETQTLARSGGSGSPNPTLAYGQTESFTYDAANRVTGSSFDGSVPEARTYTYDADGNRRSVTEAGVTFYYFYDATDALVTKNTTNVAPSTATLCADRGFCYDAMGDLTTSSPSAPDGSVLVATTYTYDPAGHLLTINAGLSGAVSFLLDALGRHWSQTSGGTTTTYAYLGTSDTVSSMSVGANVTTTSLIDAIGDRLGQGTGSAFGGWLIADLHGNIVAAVSPGSSPALLSAYRYDAYGETCGSWSASSGSIAVPWRFQGRLLESATGSTDLYDFGARSYDPSLGAFTSFDSVAGSAQNPLTLNRYLYANANPATLVDPDGHVAWQSTCRYDPEDCVDIAKAKAHAKAKASALSGTTDMTTAVNNFRSWSANTDMTSAVDKFRSDTGAGACAWDQTADECKNIAAENKKQHYWELCNGGDKSACDTMNTIQVNMGDPVGWAATQAGNLVFGDTTTDLDTTGESSKDAAGHLINTLPDDPVKGFFGRLLGFVDKVTNLAETSKDAIDAYDSGGWGPAAKAIIQDQYKAYLALGAAVACGAPEDIVGAACGGPGMWVGDKTAPLVGWGIDQLAGWNPIHF